MDGDEALAADDLDDDEDDIEVEVEVDDKGERVTARGCCQRARR